MIPEDDHASRLTQAYELLRSLVETETASETTDPRWHLPPLPMPDDRMSATDLLGWWFRPPGRGRNAWDLHFSQFPATSRNPGPPAAALAGPAPHRPGVASGAQDSVPLPLWSVVRGFVRDDEVTLGDEQAEGAVRCLFDFLHAIGRRDTRAAMTFIAQDYHCLEGDVEVDRLALQNRIEQLLDSLAGWNFDVSLSTVPEPVLHAVGVLIGSDIQVDAWRADSDERKTLVDRRVAILEQQVDGRWAISALSPMPV